MKKAPGESFTKEDLLLYARYFQNPQLFCQERVQTLHPTEGLKLFPTKKYVQNLIDFFQKNRLCVVVKSRQMFVTWTCLSLMVWKAIFEGPGVYLIFSKNERSAKELVERIKFIISNLVNIKVPAIGKYTTEEVSFSEIGSRIISLPATPESPRMHSPKGVIWDELAFTPYQDEIWTALKPAIDSGGFFWGVSTSAGPFGLFADMAKNYDDYGLSRFWLHYSEDPAKQDDWKNQVRRGYTEAQWRREYEISFEKAANAVYNFDLDRNTFKGKPNLSRFKQIYRAIDWGFVTPVCIYIGIDAEDNVFIFDEIIGDRWSLDRFIQAIKYKDEHLGITEDMIEFTACDPAGLSPGETGISPIQRLESVGYSMKYITSKILDGVDLIRTWFDEISPVQLKVSTDCERVINDFLGYELDVDGETPIKDGKHDHTLDAIRYFFVNRFGAMIETPHVQARVRSGKK